MMIAQWQLLALLQRLAPWHWRRTDWRKMPNGRTLRFVKWNFRMDGPCGWQTKGN